MKKNSYKEHPNIENLDWRLMFATTIAKDGQGVKVGDPVIAYTEVNYLKAPLGFGLPNPTALFLNSSYHLLTHAQQQLGRLQFKVNRNNRRIINDYEIIFNFYEALFASTILAYTAIDFFANSEVPDDYKYETEVKGEKVVYDKKDVEKWILLDEKLLKLLPDITGVKFTKQSPRWFEYQKLKRYRHRIIHMTKNDSRPKYSPEQLRKKSMHKIDSIWNSLIYPEIFNGHRIAFGVIGHFLQGYKEKKQPRWYKKYPNV